MDARSDGFALVEVIASLVILVMISLLIVTGVRTGHRVWERLDARTVAGEAVAGAQSLLRERIEKAYASTRLDASAPYTEFDGDAARLRFLAPAPAADGPQPVRRWSLNLGSNGDLVLSSWSDLAADPDHPAIASSVVLRGVKAIDIAYYGAGAPDFQPRWRPRWSGQATPPGLVRIRLGFGPGDRRYWPDLLIHPAVDVDALCKLDPVSGRCLGRGA